MALTKRIFQISKEFERDEKEIIVFLATQGIKVSNRLSAVSEDVYNMLKEKFLAPPPPPPEPKPEPKPAPKPEPKPAPAEEKKAPAEQPKPAAQPDKKKKKKDKPPQQPAAETPPQEGATPAEKPEKFVSDLKLENMDKRTQTILFEGIMAGNEFIKRYSQNPGQTPTNKKRKPILTANMDVWGILYNHKVPNADAAPVQYWIGVAKLMTRGFKILNGFGLENREKLAEMRNAMLPIGMEYKPREIFTEEENLEFTAQQKLLFLTFGHGMGVVNDNLFDLKVKAERMKVKYERMSFLEYVTNPQDELRSSNRVPFMELAESVAYSVRSVVRRFNFYFANKERIDGIIKKFGEWLDGYEKLKQDGAAPAKLEKYLELEKKFVDIVEFMSFDNLLKVHRIDGKKMAVFDKLVILLEDYRDKLDDPDAERDFKYKVRGVTNLIYKPKEFVFTYRFGGLVVKGDYRPPEVIAAAKAAKLAAEKENPAADGEAQA